METNSTAKRKVVSLIRVSSVEQAANDRTGIPRQLEDIGIHCRTHNLEVVKEYRLEGISGAYVEHSPVFREMVGRLSQASISGVVFASLDRFFRPEHLSAYDVLRPFESTRKLLFCDLGELDPKNQQDQMKIVIWGQMAGMERSRIRDRMMRGKEFKRHDPNSKTDPLPKGVVFANGRFQYTSDAERVKEAFQRVLKGEPIHTTALELRFGSGSALRATLKSHWWIGIKAALYHRDYGDVRKTRIDGSLADGRKVNRQEPILVPTNLAKTPLVSPTDFQKVQDILKANSNTWAQGKSKLNDFLGTGLLYCSCGLKMYHKQDARPGKPRYYLCASRWSDKTPCGNPSVNATSVDRSITYAVMTYLLDPRFVERQIKQAISVDGRSEKEWEVKRLERSVGDLDVKRKRAMEFSLEHPEFIENVKALKGEIARERLKLAKAKAELDAHLEERDVKKLAKAIKERFWLFDEWEMVERKRALNEYVERITLDADGSAQLIVKANLPAPRAEDSLDNRYIELEDDEIKELEAVNPTLDYRLMPEEEWLNKFLAKTSNLSKNRFFVGRKIESRASADSTAIPRASVTARAP